MKNNLELSLIDDVASSDLLKPGPKDSFTITQHPSQLSPSCLSSPPHSWHQISDQTGNSNLEINLNHTCFPPIPPGPDTPPYSHNTSFPASKSASPKSTFHTAQRAVYDNTKSNTTSWRKPLCVSILLLPSKLLSQTQQPETTKFIISELWRRQVQVEHGSAGPWHRLSKTKPRGLGGLHSFLQIPGWAPSKLLQAKFSSLTDAGPESPLTC